MDALAKDNRDGIWTQQRGKGGAGDQCALPWWGDVCVVALGLRTASANARVKPFGRGVRRAVVWFSSGPALSSEKDMGLPYLGSEDPSVDVLIKILTRL